MKLLNLGINLFEQKNILNESPLPDDWDKTKFIKKNNSFKSILEYCKERSQKIGQGSSRVAFEILYKDKPSILKIAKNNKGIFQNWKEVNILSDYYFKNLNIIPMIDYDTENTKPMWVHTEKAQKVTKQNCINYVIDPIFFTIVGEINLHTRHKVYYNTAIDKFTKHLKTKNIIFEEHPKYEDIITLFETVYELVNVYNILAVDFSEYGNWGIYEDKLVIIDLGYDMETYKEYYSR